mgnify:CR=1 FL=1
MKIKQHHRLAFLISIFLHILLLAVIPHLNFFKSTNKIAPIEVYFFDTTSTSGGNNINPSQTSNTTSPSKSSVAQSDTINPIVNSSVTTNIETAIKSETNSYNTAAYNNSLVQTSSSNDNTDDIGGAGSGNGSGNSSGMGTNSISNNPAVPPKIIYTLEPTYPSSARNAGISGVVRIKALVAPTGRVQDAEVYESSNNEQLDTAALKAVSKWEFTPARDIYGNQVACYTIIPIRFQLK